MDGKIFKGGFQALNQTATADTEIAVPFGPKGDNLKTRLNNIVYTSLGTAHTITIMKALARTYLTAAAAAAATTINVASASFLNQTIAASDYVLLELDDGLFQALKVSAIATLALTVPALSHSAAANNKVWVMGAITETQHQLLKPPISATTHYGGAEAGIAESGYNTVVATTNYKRSGHGDGMIIHSGNATAAGIFQLISGSHVAW